MITHRDPLRVIGSLSDLMATLHWMHSDHVDHDVLVEFMAMGLELQMDAVTAERDAGAMPDDQIADVVYKDLIADPLGVVERPLRVLGPPRDRREFRAALDEYLAARHTDRTRRARLLVRRHGARPGDAPRAGGAVPGAGPSESDRPLATVSRCRPYNERELDHLGARVRRPVGQDPAHEHVALEAPTGIEPVLHAGRGRVAR